MLFRSYILRKPNLSPIINGSYSRHDEFLLLPLLRLAISSLVPLQLVFFLQGFPRVHNLGHVIQISALVREVPSCFIKEPITIIPILVANHLIISFLFFVLYEVLVVIGRRVNVAFKYETSQGDLGCPYLQGLFWPIVILP